MENNALIGGNMNIPIKSGNKIYKDINPATNNIHELLIHLNKRGIYWIPRSFGVNNEGKHELSFIDGVVPHDNPEWIWNENILIDIARHLKHFHDATIDFVPVSDQWLLNNKEPNEIICHNDFAPYNCVFMGNKFVGLIDFDTCSPGTRLWDISYTVYRFIPLYPNENVEKYIEISPFSNTDMVQRLKLFLNAYSENNSKYQYSLLNVIEKLIERLKALADWSFDFGKNNNKDNLIEHGNMYLLHCEWLNKFKDLL